MRSRRLWEWVVVGLLGGALLAAGFVGVVFQGQAFAALGLTRDGAPTSLPAGLLEPPRESEPPEDDDPEPPPSATGLVAGAVAAEGPKPDPATLSIGVAFQEPRLLPWRTVEENIRLVLPKTRRGMDLGPLIAAFGLARIRAARSDLKGALDALNLIPSTSRGYTESRRLRAQHLMALGTSLADLGAALEAVAAAKSVLNALGFGEHEAVFAIHTDKDHQHIHLVVNRVHPVTGKTHNPNFDYDKLQAWAYQYEKGRGRVVCLERAIKHEKDPVLREEYQKRLAAETQTGKVRESKPRPQWDAEKDAPFPKSKTYQELKTELVGLARDLSKRGYELVDRQSKEWDALKTRQLAEKNAFAKQQAIAFQNRKRFNQASGVAPYSWKQYQADRAGLKKQQTVAVKKLRDQVKGRDQKAIEAMKAGQKEAWRQFYRLEKAAVRGRLEPVLKLVASTRVGDQSEAYRGHLTKLFNNQAQLGTRKGEFAGRLAVQRKEFYKGLTQANAPTFTALNDAHKQELIVLRQRFDQSRAAQKSRASVVMSARAEAQKAQRALESRQRSERAATKAKHGSETAQHRKEWADFNVFRKEKWGEYKDMRARQAEAAREQDNNEGLSSSASKPAYRSGDAYLKDRGVVGRDYGRAADPGRGSAEGGRSISRKGPSGG